MVWFGRSVGSRECIRTDQMAYVSRIARVIDFMEAVPQYAALGHISKLSE